MKTKSELLKALKLLGEVLASEKQGFDLVVIGGGALLLQDLIARPTLDLDVIAQIVDGHWQAADKPLPEALLSAIRAVAITLDLPREPRDEKDWLNSGPSFIHKLGLPDGFEARADKHVFGSLTVRIASRQDLITLKIWAATDIQRGSRRAVDINDLRELHPTHAELSEAIRWCATRDGRDDFLDIDARPVLNQLGVDKDWRPK